MRPPIRTLSFGWPVLLCALAAAQQPHGLNKVPPPIEEILIPPPPYVMDSSVRTTPDLLMRLNEGWNTPGMNVYIPQPEETAPLINTNDALLWGPYDLTITEARSGWSDRARLAPLCRPPACWSPWPWSPTMQSIGGCPLPRIDTPTR
jgi:hypothetical protein